MLLIFDLDLTLCDNAERRVRSFERALGRRLSEDELRFVRRDLGENVLRHFRSITMRDFFHHFLYDEELFELDVPLDGAVETLRELARRHKLYYVTGRPVRRTAERFLERFGFPPGGLYAELVGPGESYKKTRFFRDILQREGLSWGIAVGDMPGDGVAAREAGLYAVGTLQARESDSAELRKACDEVVRHIREVVALVERLEGRATGPSTQAK